MHTGTPSDKDWSFLSTTFDNLQLIHIIIEKYVFTSNTIFDKIALGVKKAHFVLA